ncbi:tripartite tricarboxylate transporter substrate binding protein [Ramlibacter tataouinensis]|uniref:Bug family tripartite tricarboxylate transporter substrate binding protein n=1 Tax=Ramlibacter tataouinensis TaxID=94132 RepID=UPI0022F3BB8B|nr:tripartite tricarboxylate transporter substrate binding protein [Ramlibacter tataouinensis]WBY00563.1 tripartite tricarboxylate transporter substrate binding protein [Ramlibacter tataouinensis]
MLVRFSRRAFAAACCGAVLALPAAAAGFPDKPITFVMPWPAGGGSDIAMRLVADAAGKKIGQPIVVVNRPGAGGAIGIKEIADAAPDGYTVGMIGSGAVAAQYMNPNANALADLQPIAFFGEDPAAITASAALPYKTVSEFVAAAKASPESIRNGNDQPGGAAFTFISLYEKQLGIKVKKVNFSGYAPAITALLSGEVQTISIAVPDLAEHHKAGKVRVLGVSGPTRHFMLPDVPTFKEQGFNVMVGSWRTIAGPKGIPPERLAKLEEAFRSAMAEPDFIARAKDRGFFVSPGGVKEAAQVWNDADKTLYPLLLDAGLIKVRRK